MTRPNDRPPWEEPSTDLDASRSRERRAATFRTLTYRVYVGALLVLVAVFIVATCHPQRGEDGGFSVDLHAGCGR